MKNFERCFESSGNLTIALDTTLNRSVTSLWNSEFVHRSQQLSRQPIGGVNSVRLTETRQLIFTTDPFRCREPSPKSIANHGTHFFDVTRCELLHSTILPGSAEADFDGSVVK